MRYRLFMLLLATAVTGFAQDLKTNDFLIDEHVYDKITDATTDVWVPSHMNHMYVTEGYRTWHGEPFKEGYLQAPESDHFDLHRQGATTDTKSLAHRSRTLLHPNSLL